MSGPTQSPLNVNHFRSHDRDPNALARFNEFMSGPVVAVTGSRACTDYGSNVAVELGRFLASQGVTVLTGGAYGIEAAAMRGALAAGGKVIVALPCGSNSFHPAGNAPLLKQVIAQGGLVISTLPKPDTLPSRENFAIRCRFIAEVAGALVVVESTPRSAALMTAGYAADAQVPVYAVPGPVTSLTSDGPHTLLRSGAAQILTSGEDLGDLSALVGRHVTLATGA